MTYRGVVQNGVVVMNKGATLPDGAVVEVSLIEEDGSPFQTHPAFGIWRDRTDMTDSVETSRRLRATIEHEGMNE